MNAPVRAREVDALFSDAVAFELWGRGEVDSLFPAEAMAVADAIDARRSQFAAGRACARRALAELGVEPTPILTGDRREPRWPPGITGSISHTEGYAVAVVARRPMGDEGARPTLGIDAERIGRVGPDLYDRLFLPAERARLSALTEGDQAEAATVLFGAKESFYKAQFASTAAWVGFHDVELRPDGGDHTLHRATDLAVLDRFAWPGIARHVVRDGRAITAVEAIVVEH